MHNIASVQESALFFINYFLALGNNLAIERMDKINLSIPSHIQGCRQVGIAGAHRC